MRSKQCLDKNLKLDNKLREKEKDSDNEDRIIRKPHMVKRQISGKRQQRQHYIRRQQINTTTVHKNIALRWRLCYNSYDNISGKRQIFQHDKVFQRQYCRKRQQSKKRRCILKRR